MSTAFTRTVRSLEADRFLRPGAVIAGVAVFLGAWALWASRWPVTLREVSTRTRVEVDGATVAVQSPIGGRIVRTYLAVGSMVKEGDPLLEIDSSPERLQYQEEKTRAETIAPTLAALRDQIRAQTQARLREQEAARTAVEEARANQKSAEAPAQYAAAELERLEKLRQAGVIAERDYLKAKSEVERSTAIVQRERLVAERVAGEQRTRESDRDAGVLALEAEIAKLEAQAATAQAAMRRLENEMERRVVRAPFAGRIGEAAVIRPGGVVAAGEKIAAIVPESKLVVVAQFPPAAALGRVREGQSGELRLEGFPWAQWGTVPVEVSRVSSEIRDGLVRVEMKVDPARPCRIPLQHGLPGTVEVAVEQVTPGALVLRLAGRYVTEPRSAFQAGSL